MKKHQIQLTTTWTDSDANGHIGNTAYSKYATHARVAIFANYGLPPHRFVQLQTGPVLLREELRYLKELHMLEQITVDCVLKAASRDYKKFHFYQEIHNQHGELSAAITVEGIWMDLRSRRSTVPPAEIKEVCSRFAHTQDFNWLP